MQRDRWQRALHSGTLALQSGSHLASPTERFNRLVERKPWRIGSQFKQHAARLTKVNGVKVSAVEHWCDIQRTCHQHFAPLELRSIVSSTKRDMMHTARAHAAVGELGLDQDIDVIAQGASFRGKAEAGTVLSYFAKTHGAKHGYRFFVATFTKGYAEEAPNRVFRGNVAGAWGLSLGCVRVAYDLQPHAIGIGEAEHFLLKPFTRAFHRDAG